MKKEWRHYRLQLDKTYLMYFQLDEVSLDSYRFTNAISPLRCAWRTLYTYLYVHASILALYIYQCTIKCTLCFQCNEPKHKILRSKIVSATAGKVLLIKKVNRFTFVVNFSDDTPSWIFAADTEVSCKSRRGILFTVSKFRQDMYLYSEAHRYRYSSRTLKEVQPFSWVGC